MIFIIIAFTRRILNCISANRRENHAPALPISWPPLTEDPIPVAPLESQGSFWLWFLQADIIENLYSSITHMLLSMHVHFLIITYILISCIFSKLVSQCASVRMTQFFYILIYSIHVKRYCYCLTLNCYCLISNCYCPISNCYCPISNCYYPTVTVQFPTVTVQFPTVTVWTLIRFLTISKVLKLHFKWDWSR